MKTETEIAERIAYIKARLDLSDRDKTLMTYMLEWVLECK